MESKKTGDAFPSVYKGHPGDLFAPEMPIASRATTAGMNVLRPLLAESGAARAGKYQIGTVKEDLNDIKFVC